MYDTLYPVFTTSGEVAQLVEQRTENSRVVGSTPTLATSAPIVYRLGHGLFMPVRAVRLRLGVPFLSAQGRIRLGSSFFVFCGDAGGVLRFALT